MMTNINDTPAGKAAQEAQQALYDQGVADGYIKGVADAKAHMLSMPSGLTVHPKLEKPQMPRGSELKELQLTTWAFNCLAGAGIRTIGQLLDTPAQQLLEIESFGPTCLKNVEEKLEEHGYTLAAHTPAE